ncbi:hypothetical protein AC629_13710 [Bradyrhizobium sp. NAS80.1]|uniref:hypothetical protein n=1 Tax=Bradyrhizobium sp. NAS80.1 TaxID=1680159 RepID=UPI0009617553|nr:hypothetical protein [Bradyrhizobium sp. NAS80.1]OKO87514.1 hypothetical protein AC629_13710 [Bradyrhizobium sp. NAS80.1]
MPRHVACLLAVLVTLVFAPAATAADIKVMISSGIDLFEIPLLCGRRSRHRESWIEAVVVALKFAGPAITA